MLKAGIIGHSDEVLSFIPVLDEVKNAKICSYLSLEAISSTSKNQFNGIKIFYDEEDFFSSIDAVIVISKPSDFYPIIVAALKSSKHLFFNDFYFQHLNELESFVKLTQEASVFIAIEEYARYCNSFKQIAPYIKSPKFIEISKSKTTSSQSESAIAESGILECLHLSFMLSHSNIRRILANSMTIASENVDLVHAKVEFENGCFANITTKQYERQNHFTCKIYQMESVIEIDFQNDHSVLYKCSENSRKLVKILDYIELKEKPIYSKVKNLESFFFSINKITSKEGNLRISYMSMKALQAIIEKINLLSSISISL